MKIKKFTARTFSEALALVRKELSQDAVILATEEKKGLRPHVEVTAGIDYEPVRNVECGMRNERQKDRSEIRKEPAREEIKEGANLGQAEDERQTDNSAFRIPHSAFSEVAALKDELSGLRTMLEEMKSSGYEMALPAKKRAVVNFLTDRAVRPEYALRLCDKTTDIDEIPLYISADIRVKRHTGNRKAVMLIGPTGVGKTTTVAKLAAHAVKAGKKAAVINLDTYRIGAAEQLRIYSRILGIPLATATTTAEFRSSLLKFSESRDVVFIDTTGRNPRDASYIGAVAELCKSDVPLETHLLMNANGDDACMIEAARSYGALPIDYLGFTKVDEAVRFGSLYNLMVTYQKPVAYITTGQRVPGDIEHATVNRLAGLIVKQECYA